MSAMRRVPDPYRVLGVNRGADAAQIKSAHRRLAKRHHPDAPGGDEDRFVAVQEAYQLLSDPLRRREWDRSHAPGPVDARDRGSRASARAASTRWTREDAGGAYRRTRTTRGATGAHRRDDATGVAGSQRSGRDPGARRTAWTAEGVPWWEDFTPKGRSGRGPTDQRATAGRRATGRRAPGPGRAAEGDSRPAQGEPPPAQGEPPPAQAETRPAGGEPRPAGDMDAFVRSSGAAWSSAARRHFRRDEATLPSRGAFRYRGTQVVTGAEARKVAAEEAAAQEAAAAALFRRARPVGGDAPPPRAFDHDEPEPREEAAPSSSTVASSAPGAATAPRRDAPASPQPRPVGHPARPQRPRATPSHERAGPGPVVTGALVATAIAAIPVVLGASAGTVDPAAPPAIGALALGALIGGLAGWLIARLAPRAEG